MIAALSCLRRLNGKSALLLIGAAAIAFALTESAAARHVRRAPPHGLERVENSELQIVYAHSGIDWTTYNTIKLRPLAVTPEVRSAASKDYRSRYPRSRVVSYVLGDRDVAALQDSFQKTFRNVLGDAGFRFVDKPLANTLIVHPILADITLNSAVERSRRYSGRGDVASNGDGALTMSAVIADGATGQVLAEVGESRFPSNLWRVNGGVTNLGDARMIFGIWSRALRDKLRPK